MLTNEEAIYSPVMNTPTGNKSVCLGYVAPGEKLHVTFEDSDYDRFTRIRVVRMDLRDQCNAKILYITGNYSNPNPILNII